MLYSDIDRMCTLRGKATTDKILHNMAETVLSRSARTGAIALSYRNTDVLTFYPNNRVMLKTGGWFTQTTMRRMEDFLNGKSGDGSEMPIHVSVGGNPWRIVTRRRNPAHVDWHDDEPCWLPIADHPYTEGAVIDLLTGEIVDCAMVDFAAYNKAMNKAIKAYITGITPETFIHGIDTGMVHMLPETASLEESVRTQRYDAQTFQNMLKARYQNGNFLMNSYFWPLVDGKYAPDSYNARNAAEFLRREMIGYLRAMLLIGPVPIRKNYGSPRRIR